MRQHVESAIVQTRERTVKPRKMPSWMVNGVYGPPGQPVVRHVQEASLLDIDSVTIHYLSVAVNVAEVQTQIQNHATRARHVAS